MRAESDEPDFKYPGWTFEFDRGDATAEVRKLKEEFDEAPERPHRPPAAQPDRAETTP